MSSERNPPTDATQPTELGASRSAEDERKRLDDIFGRDLGTDEPPRRGGEAARDDWYRENRPPHHDR